MGRNQDPVTLHKYLYAHSDPANLTDPTGNFAYGLGKALNILATVSNVSYSVFQIATGEEELTAKKIGSAILFNMLGGKAIKYIGLLGKKVAKTCNSFDGETLVATEFGLTPISQIKIGDSIWAYNEQTDEKSLQEVVHLITGEGYKKLVDIELASGEVIVATVEHPFYLPETKEWIDAGDLTEEHTLLDLLNNPLGVISVTVYFKQAKVYNLTVANDHTYYVGQSGVLSHNTNKTCSIGGVVYGVDKPKLYQHKKHQSGGPKGGKVAGLEPDDSFLAMSKTGIKHENGTWYARSTDGKSIYRYFPGGQKSGEYHWSGSTGDLKAPLSKSDIPSGIIKALGFKVKGSKL